MSSAIGGVGVRRLVAGLLVAGLLVAGACRRAPEPAAPANPVPVAAQDAFPVKAQLRYAKAFTVEYHGQYKVVAVQAPWLNRKEPVRYLLVQRGAPVPTGYPGVPVITVPVTRVVTMSSTFLGQLVALGQVDCIAGHDQFAYINSPEVRTRIDAGQLREVGEGAGVNLEVMLELKPELVLVSDLGDGEFGSQPRLAAAGFKVAAAVDFMEQTPLGRTEWLKFTALFFNREAEAEQLFTDIARQYNDLAVKARAAASKPTVLLGSEFKGVWWMPGGRSFMAQLLADAGATYAWAGDQSVNSIQLDYEVVYEKCGNAEFWLDPGTWQSLAEGLTANRRYADFAAFRTGRVYNYNARVNEHGGNDFWESGVVKPHVILADLLKILHPELLPEHQLYYYRQLAAAAN